MSDLTYEVATSGKRQVYIRVKESILKHKNFVFYIEDYDTSNVILYYTDFKLCYKKIVPKDLLPSLDDKLEFEGEVYNNVCDSYDMVCYSFANRITTGWTFSVERSVEFCKILSRRAYFNDIINIAGQLATYPENMISESKLRTLKINTDLKMHLFLLEDVYKVVQIDDNTFKLPDDFSAYFLDGNNLVQISGVDNAMLLHSGDKYIIKTNDGDFETSCLYVDENNILSQIKTDCYSGDVKIFEHIHLFNLIMTKYNGSVDLYNRYITASYTIFKEVFNPKVSLIKAYKSANMFDFIKVEFSVTTRVNKDYIRENKHLLDEIAVAEINRSKQFRRHNISLNYFRVGRLTLRKDGVLEYIFEPKLKGDE